MKWVKVTGVIVGAVIVTALGIDAADTISGSRGTLLSQVIEGGKASCPVGMVAISNNSTLTCVDAYEASPSSNCPYADPDNISFTYKNIESSSCVPESKKEVVPWRFVSRDQAMQACAKVGKRLPTSEEWYQISLGLTAAEQNCNIASNGLMKTGNNPACVTPEKVFDTVGNVWEWVSDDIIDGTYKNRSLPETGYVAQVDASGMATVSTSTEQELFGKDYFWSATKGSYGVIRGGFYGSESDAGLYTVHADTLPTTAGTAIGFRCVK